MSGYPGVATAVVVTEPDDQGRVGVHYPWLPAGDALAPSWAPVAVPLAGANRGAWLMPEVGDEVLVSFQHGDRDHPFVVGFLWNGVDPPPETDRQNRVILTPGGHTLRFEDGDAKKVVLKTAGGHHLTLDDDGSAVTLHSNGGHELKVDDTAGTITVSLSGGASKVELTSSAVTLTGGGRSVALTGGQVQIS